MALAAACPLPDRIAASVSAQDLLGWTMEWINAYSCERGKRSALIEAWPK